VNPALVATLVVVALLAIPVAAAGRAWWRPIAVAVLGVGAIVALGTPTLRGAHGFLVEPVRAWGAHAIVAAVTIAGLLRTIPARRWGLVAAGTAFALFGGHAALVIGGLVVADVAFASIAFDERPRTLHAGIGSRTVALVLLASDVASSAALLLGSAGAAEPLVVGGGVVATLAVSLRCVCLLALGGERIPTIAPVILGASILAPLGWLSAADARATGLVAAAVAAGSAWTWARTSSRAGFVSSLVALSLVAMASADASGLPLVPLLLLCAIGAAVLPDLLTGASLLVVTLAGGASMGALVELTDVVTTGASDDPWRALTAAAVAIAAVMLPIGALGIVRRTPESDARPVLLVPIAVVLGGLLAVAIGVADRVLDALDGPILAARAPGTIGFTSPSIPSWIGTAALAVAVAWWAFERGPLRSTLPVAVRIPSVPRVGPSIEEVASATWQRSVALVAGAALVLVVVVLARSAFRGWL
jgi:hypothetical protein